ncbi:hypothetical protein ACRJ4W_47500 [Streptomyces sp. GLT-R25]
MASSLVRDELREAHLVESHRIALDAPVAVGVVDRLDGLPRGGGLGRGGLGGGGLGRPRGRVRLRAALLLGLGRGGTVRDGLGGIGGGEAALPAGRRGGGRAGYERLVRRGGGVLGLPLRRGVRVVVEHDDGCDGGGENRHEECSRKPEPAGSGYA